MISENIYKMTIYAVEWIFICKKKKFYDLNAKFVCQRFFLFWFKEKNFKYDFDIL